MKGLRDRRVLSGALIFFALVVSCVVHWWGTERFVQRQVLVWESEIARRILSVEPEQRDESFLRRVTEQIVEMDPSLRAGSMIMNDGSAVWTDSETSCFAPIVGDLRLYSVPAGRMVFCRSFSGWLWRSVSSPAFLGLALLVILIGSVMSLQAQRARQEKEASELRWLAEKRVNDLARSVAHDIRGPVTALRALAAHDPAWGANELLQNTIQRIEMLARGLLSERTVTPESALGIGLEIVSATEAVLREARLRHAGRIIEFRNDLRGESPRVAIESLSYSRALGNLVDNAVESGSPESPVWILAERAGDLIRVAVIDQGRGIPEEILSRLGKEEISHGKPNGTGLGFKSAQELVSSAGGRLNVVSKEGAGTRIDMYLPIMKES